MTRHTSRLANLAIPAFTLPLTLLVAAPAARAHEPWSGETLLGSSDDPLLPLSGFSIGSDGHASDPGLWTSARPDGHAPIGVTGDHTHGAGEWMLSLRFMRMHMDGMRDGTDRLSSQEVLSQGYMATPLHMDTDMLMLGGMYAPTGDLTLMAMLPYVSKSMEHVTGTGTHFTTRADGVGDVRLSGLYKVLDRSRQRVHLNLGLSVPTGSVDEHDDTPAMADAKLPYPMQLGSGTWDLLPGLTYLGQGEAWSWGAQGIACLRLGDNSEGYSLGDRFDATAWLARRFGGVSASLRLAYSEWGNVDGTDDEVNPAMVPTADPHNQGGRRLSALAGLNCHAHEGVLAGHRLGIEVGLPVYQDLDGPQLGGDWVATIGWQYSH